MKLIKHDFRNVNGGVNPYKRLLIINWRFWGQASQWVMSGKSKYSALDLMSVSEPVSC